MELKLRKTVIGGQAGGDDFQVIWDGIPVGRIVKQGGIPKGMPAWAWGVTFPYRPQMAWHRGMAADFEDCKLRFKLAWGAIEPKLTEEEIRKARDYLEDLKTRPWNRR